MLFRSQDPANTSNASQTNVLQRRLPWRAQLLFLARSCSPLYQPLGGFCVAAALVCCLQMMLQGAHVAAVEIEQSTAFSTGAAFVTWALGSLVILLYFHLLRSVWRPIAALLMAAAIIAVQQITLAGVSAVMTRTQLPGELWSNADLSMWSTAVAGACCILLMWMNVHKLKMRCSSAMQRLL